MGVGLVRSLQPPDILWIHWRVYNFIANTRKGVLFLPSSDVYARSFLYLLYTLIKLYYTKALSDQAWSLALDWILLRRPRIPVSLRGSATTFHLEGPSRILQEMVRILGALVLCSPRKHIFCCTLLTLRCACVKWMKRSVWSKWGALLCSCTVTSYGLWQKPVGGLYRPANSKRHPTSPLGTNQKWAKLMDWTFFSLSNFSVSLTISLLLGN